MKTIGRLSGPLLIVFTLVGVTQAGILITPETTAVTRIGFESDVLANDLANNDQPTFLSASDTVANGSGGAISVINDGTTGPNNDSGFRGYQSPNYLVLNFDTSTNTLGYDITGITSFAGHPDWRASQDYDVKLAFANDPTTFVPLTSASVASTGGSTKLSITDQGGGYLDSGTVSARGVSSLRFEFKESGFGVYREFDVLGGPTTPNPYRHEIGGDSNLGTDQQGGLEQNVIDGPLTGAKTIQVRQNVNDTFQIAEIQAFETVTGTNVALQANGGVATATSNAHGGVPTRANDGNTSGQWGDASVWHSSEKIGATLTVTLSTPTALDSVHVWGRTDCCKNRQDDFNLIISDASNVELFNEQITGVGTSATSNRNISVEAPVSGEVLATLTDLDIYAFELEASNADMLEVVNPMSGVFTTILDVNNATLEIETLAGTFQPGDSWQLLMADEFRGTFDQIILPNLAVQFDTSRLLIDGTLRVQTAVVPEPSTFVLAVLGLLGLGWYGRRKPST